MERKRSKSINAAAIISLITAIILILFSLLFGLMTIIAKNVVELPRTPSETFLFEYGLLIGLGILLWGIIDFFVWFGLRRLKKWAGILGVAVCILTMTLSIFLAQLRDVIHYVVNTLIIILICVGWNSLYPSQSKAAV